MDMNSITQLISTVGFPICMCGALFWYMLKEKDAHKEEISLLKTSIDKLEFAITNLCNFINKEEKE